MAETKIAEIPAGETARARHAMADLRPWVGGEAEFSALVDNELRPQGYRLVGAFDGDVSGNAVAVAGFRISRNLAWGQYLYVDDLVTTPETRGRGLGRALLDWLHGEAQTQGCSQLHLDSGTHRQSAHRFYFASGMVVSSFHFSRDFDV